MPLFFVSLAALGRAEIVEATGERNRKGGDRVRRCVVVPLSVVRTSLFDTCLLLHLLQSCSCAGKCEYASVSPASNVTLSHQKHHFKKIFSFHSSFSPPKCRTNQTSGDTYDCEPSQLLAQLIWCPSYYQHHLHHRLISKRPQLLWKYNFPPEKP